MSGRWYRFGDAARGSERGSGARREHRRRTCERWRVLEGEGTLRLDLERLDIAPGLYHLDVGLYGPEWTEVLDYLLGGAHDRARGRSDQRPGRAAVFVDHPLSDGERASAGERGRPRRRTRRGCFSARSRRSSRCSVGSSWTLSSSTTAPVQASLRRPRALGDPRVRCVRNDRSGEVWRPHGTVAWTNRRPVTGSRSSTTTTCGRRGSCGASWTPLIEQPSARWCLVGRGGRRRGALPAAGR